VLANEANGKRTLLRVSVSLSEAEVPWRALLEALRKRGLKVTKLITRDGPPLDRAQRAPEPRYCQMLWIARFEGPRGGR
jgi:hypothetical protein